MKVENAIKAMSKYGEVTVEPREVSVVIRDRKVVALKPNHKSDEVCSFLTCDLEGESCVGFKSLKSALQAQMR